MEHACSDCLGQGPSSGRHSSLLRTRACLILLLVASGVVTVVSQNVTSAPYDDSFVCTVGVNDGGRQVMQSVDAAFMKDTHPHIDLAIVMDRSESITSEGFQYTKDVIKQVLDYVIRSGYLYVHPEFDRVSIFSFGKQSTAELNGFQSKSNPVTMCQVDTLLAEMLHIQSKESNIIQALKDVQSAFRGRPDAKKIMWVFFDGENTDDDPDNPTDPKDTALDLREEGVEIFAAGVGSPAIRGWMTTIDKENVVAGLATDRNRYYACVETWKGIFDDRLADLPRGDIQPPSDHNVDRYVLAIGGRCPQYPCSEDNSVVCTCNTPKRAFECKNKDDVYNPDIYEVVTGRGTDGLSLVTIIIAIAAPILLIVIFIVVVACCIAYRKRKKRGLKGPPLPPPPLIRRKVQPQLAIHGTDPDYNNLGDWVKSEDVEDTYMDQEEMIYQKIADVEKGMPGWGDYLIQRAKENRLSHLSIHDTSSSTWASTPGKHHVHRREIRDIQRSFREKDGDYAYVNSDLKVAGRKYKVDHRASRGPRVCAVRGRGDKEETVWVGQEGPYIVVAIVPSAFSGQCQQALVDLNQYLQRMRPEGQYDNAAPAFDNAGYSSSSSSAGNEVIYDDTYLSSSHARGLQRL